jgi:uncharacterized protein (DUF3820 family)
MKLKEVIKNRERKRRADMRSDYNKVYNLSKQWNPLPVRGQLNTKLKHTVSLHCNFINCKEGFFNMGKYKGIDVISTPISYLKWVKENVNLNDTELKLLKRIINKK